jgi:hypothetical protein
MDVSLTLPSEIGQLNNMRDVVVVYLENQLEEMGIPDHIANALKPHLKIVSRNNPVSIRDVGKILNSVTLLSGDILQNGNYKQGWIIVLITLLVSKVIRPDIYKSFISLSFGEDDLEHYFDATFERRTHRIDGEYNSDFDRYTMSQYYSWLYLAKAGKLPDDEPGMQEFIRGLFSEWSVGPDDPQSIPMRVRYKWLELFKAQ